MNNEIPLTRKILAGVPQGILLGPFLSILYTNYIPIFKNTHISKYTHDTAYVTQKCLKNFKPTLKTAKNSYHHFLKEKGAVNTWVIIFIKILVQKQQAAYMVHQTIVCYIFIVISNILQSNNIILLLDRYR